jgi:hypothetical protein
LVFAGVRGVGFHAVMSKQHMGMRQAELKRGLAFN